MIDFFKKLVGKQKDSTIGSSNFRILFTTDIHGSNVCYKKLLNTVQHPKLAPDVLIIGGDITGKDLVYIIHDESDKTYKSTERGKQIHLGNKEEAQRHEKKMSDCGSYIYWCKYEEYYELTKSKEKQDILLKRLIEERIQEWIIIAEKKLAGSKVQLIINTGNDDFFSIDGLLQISKTIIFPEGKIIQFENGINIISCGYANLTPFGCPRDISEENLKIKLEEYISLYLSKDLDINKCIFNFHCPPINTRLDIGPKLINGTQPTLTGLGKETEHVGSSAVREIIEKYQPLLGIHGHIHESPGEDKIGNTIIVNPGSEYQTGIFRFALLEFNEASLQTISIKIAL